MEGGESRYVDPRFDNVSDYHGFSMPAIVDVNNNAVAGLVGYNASVTVANAGDLAPPAGDPSALDAAKVQDVLLFLEYTLD